MNTKFDTAKEILEKNNQAHIIPFLENGKNGELIDQILKIDFDELRELYEKTKVVINVKKDDLTPITALNPNKLSKEELNDIEKIGESIVRNNKFAVGTMAGRTRNKTWT